MKRPLVPILAVVGVIVVGMLAIGFWSTSRPASAEETAARYLDALSSGDADAVRALLADADAVPDTAWSAFSAASAHLSAAEIVEVDESEDSAQVRAEATLDGEPQELAFTLASSPSGWHVAEVPLSPVTVTATRGAWVDVAGEPVALEGGAAQVALLPGSYEVTAWPAEYLDGAATAEVGTSAEPVAVDLAPTFTDQALADAEAELTAHLEGCLATASEVPQGCGMIVPWPADLAEAAEVSFRADRMPETAIDLETGTFQATGGAVVATVTGTRPDGTDGVFTYRTDAWSLYGTISLDDEGLLLSVN